MDDIKKDPAAQSLVARRWARTSAKQRSEIARKLNEARWGNAAKRKKNAAVKRKKSTRKPLLSERTDGKIQT